MMPEDSVKIVRRRRKPALIAQGERLRLAREDAGLTRDGLASLVGISRQYVSLLELGRRRGTVDLLRRLAAALRVPLARLIG